jgi:hypothetical protein
MPVHSNSIGDFEFLSMEGQVFYRQQEIEVIDRPGVTGSGARRLGRRGKPFTVLTMNYEANLLAAEAKMQMYIEMKDTEDLVGLVRHDVPEGFFLVLEVREQSRYAITNSIGGLVGGEECCHEVAWTLLG